MSRASVQRGTPYTSHFAREIERPYPPSQFFRAAALHAVISILAFSPASTFPLSSSSQDPKLENRATFCHLIGELVEFTLGVGGYSEG